MLLKLLQNLNLFHFYIVLDLFLKCKGRGLFYIGTNQAIINVYRWIGENYPQLVGDIGIYTSIMDKEQKQKEREKKLLLSTTKSAGLGEDIHDLKMTVVLAEPFKSKVLARQSLGRTRDSDTRGSSKDRIQCGSCRCSTCCDISKITPGNCNS